MKERICQDKIHIVTEYSQKAKWEEQLRYLWRNCFHDPRHYEDFYFDMVYSGNTVYVMEDKGMVHLNYYLCKVMNKEIKLPYIVGVSTDEKYRRQGVMRGLLERIFCDLYCQRVPFAYLMPAKEEYYIPFGFRAVSKKTEYEVKNDNKMCSQRFLYLSYAELQKRSMNFRTQLFATINQWLEQRYDVYALHEKAYYDLLHKEKLCQSGDVVFCFEETVAIERLCGMFAYAMDEELPYVEQLIVKDCISQSVDEVSLLLGSFFNEYGRIKFTKSYPYMFRIVHRAAFLELFGEKLSKLYDGAVDGLTDTQLISILFEGKDNIYFAEII